MSVVRGHDDRSREPIVQLPNNGLSMIKRGYGRYGGAEG